MKTMRPFLYSYNLVFDLPAFLSEVRNEAQRGDYSYLAVAEKRCFNLFYAEYPDTKKLCSFQGLLTQCAQFAEYYKHPPQNRRPAFPKVLLVDDLLIHGRRLRKFIDQMENEILGFLYPNNDYTDEQKYYFRKDFLDAIEIRVYAKTIGTVLLEDNYNKKIKTYKVLSYGELKDLSLQLSDTLLRWNITNTNYSPSVWIKPFDKVPKGWFKVSWKHEEESMILFIRARDGAARKSISTIRLFPERCFNKIFVPLTSYTFIGKMRRQALDRLCDNISVAIKKQEKNVVQLCDLLESKENGNDLARWDNQWLKRDVESIKRELMDYFAAVFDLRSFLKEVDEEYDSYGALLKSGFDVKKIALNFGCREPFQRESLLSGDYNTSIVDDFQTVFRNDGLCKEIKRLLDESVNMNTEDMPDLFDGESVSETKLSEMYETVNRDTLRFFFELGLSAEKQAYDLSNKPYLFYSRTYQEYDSYNEGAAKGKDGAILLDAEGMLRTIRQYKNYPAYCYLASHLYMMDWGIHGNRGCTTGDGFSATMVKAGELAPMFFPKLMAGFISAFAYIEDCFNFLNTNKAVAIADFYKTVADTSVSEMEMVVQQYLLKKKQNMDEENGAEESTEDKMGIIIQYIKDSWPEPDDVFYYTKKLYQAGQNYNGWNFLNICHPYYDTLFPLQKYFREKAIRFMKSKFY